jgi:hypothetical protein
MAWKAKSVKRKFVRAMERDVSVGLWKPTRRKIVAEKYIREFYWTLSVSRQGFEWGLLMTYEAA